MQRGPEFYLGNAEALPIIEERQPIGYVTRSGVVQPLETYSFLGAVNLGIGEPGIDPPQKIAEFLKTAAADGRLLHAIAHYPENRFTEGLDGQVRERFGIKDRPVIVYGGEGSIGLIKTALRELPDISNFTDLRLVSLGPHFPEYVGIIKMHGTTRDKKPRIPYAGLIPPIHFTANEKIEYLIQELDREKDEGSAIIVIDNPCNPTGDFASKATMAKLAMYAAKNNHLLLVDEAYADTTPDEESSIGLTERFNNLIVARSYSKAFAPGLRLGYLVMSEEIGNVFKTLQLPFEVNGIQQLFLRDVMTNDLIQEHRQKLITAIGETKPALVEGLQKLGIWVAPTHPHVPILLAHGPDNFYRELLRYQIITENGYDFRSTAPLDHSWVRMRVPGNIDDVQKVLKRIQIYLREQKQSLYEDGVDRLAFIDSIAQNEEE